MAGAGTLRRSKPSAVRIWVMAARLRTLPAAIAPVLVGTSLALEFMGFAGPDVHEGMRSLRERRAPDFPGGAPF